MSKKRTFIDYMSYIENVSKTFKETNYIQEDVNTEEEIEEPKVPVKTNSNKPKSTSVKIVEDRIRTKLDSVGLNTNVINEVVSYVLYNIDDVKELNEIKVKKEQPQVQVKENTQSKLNTVMGRAEAILDCDTFTQPLVPEPVIDVNGPLNEEITNNNIENFNLNNTSERASALLL